MSAQDHLGQQFGDYSLSYRTEDMGERKPRHIIEAMHPEAGKVGELNWYGTTGTIHHIEVDQAHGRQGLGTAMWNMAQESPKKPKHSADRTVQGDAWAKSVGGPRPRNQALNRA